MVQVGLLADVLGYRGLPEVLALSSRILVMREGHLVGELTHEDADQEKLLQLMAGVTAG